MKEFLMLLALAAAVGIVISQFSELWESFQRSLIRYTQYWKELHDKSR